MNEPRILAYVPRHHVHSGSLSLHHVRIEIRWPAHRLTSIIDDEIQPRKVASNCPQSASTLGVVAHIEPKDFQAISPFTKIRFLCIALRRIAGNAWSRSGATGAQQFETRLIADLHTSAGQKRDPTMQIRQFGPLIEVELRALWTHLIVKMMNH